MNKIIPFSKDITFKDVIGEITSIALDDNLSFDDKYTIKGELTVRGCHKVNDLEEDFSYNIPVLISVDEKYDTDKASIIVDDFYYEIINENILRVKIDLLLDDLFYKEEDVREEQNLLMKDKDSYNLSLDTEKFDVSFEKESEQENKILLNTSDDNKITDLFKENNDEKQYSIYRVYTVGENDTIDGILEKYQVTKDELEQFNDLTKFDIGMKLIIPGSDEQ